MENNQGGDYLFESELYELFINELGRMYNLNDEDKIYKYFKLRYLVYNSDKKENELDIFLNQAKFLLSELNIPLTKDNFFIYKNSNIFIFNTIYNIIKNWEFRASLIPEIDIWKNVNQILTMDDFINKSYEKIIHKANINAKKIAQNEYEYNIYKKYYGLLNLNKLFNTTVCYPKIFKDIFYGGNHNPYKRTLEEELEGIIHSFEFKSNKLSLITEKDLENYLIKNVEKIEKGMKYINKEIIADGGRIDILAKDNNEIYSIIELKVKEDKELPWQCIYYPEVIREKFRTNKVRMITLCPEYRLPMKKTLSKIENVEMLSYSLILYQKRIIDINIKKETSFN